MLSRPCCVFSLALALLCLAFSPLGDFGAARLHAVTASSPAPLCNTGPRLLVLVTSSTEPVYLTQRAIWRLLARSHPCVNVIFLWDAADSLAGVAALAAGAPRLVGGTEFFVPGATGIRPGIALKVMAALQEFADELEPAGARIGDAPCRDTTRCRKFAFVLKTNLSSFWVWTRLLHWIAAGGAPRFAAYAGMILHFEQGIPLAASGAGTLMSSDVALLLLRHNASLDWSGLLYDDIAVGKLMADFGIKLFPMTRTDYVEDCVDLPTELDDGVAYHFRVKCHNRVRDDASAFARLYAEVYGEGELFASWS